MILGVTIIAVGLIAGYRLSGARNRATEEAQPGSTVAATGEPISEVRTEIPTHMPAASPSSRGASPCCSFGADKSEEVSLNTPVFEGYEIYTDSDARAEIAFGDDRFARFGDGAHVRVARYDGDGAQLALTSGTMTLRPRRV